MSKYNKKSTKFNRFHFELASYYLGTGPLHCSMVDLPSDSIGTNCHFLNGYQLQIAYWLGVRPMYTSPSKCLDPMWLEPAQELSVPPQFL